MGRQGCYDMSGEVSLQEKMQRRHPEWPLYVVKLEEAREYVRNLHRSGAILKYEQDTLIGIIAAAEAAVPAESGGIAS